jgi:hypothetical protein
MTEIVISELTDYGIDQDGRGATLNFLQNDGAPISLWFNSVELEKLLHELGFVITKMRELSELPKQGIISMLRPTKATASLLNDDRTVVVTLELRTGLVLHYGFEPNLASALAARIEAEAQRGMRTPSPRGH